jgi:hypothetical protein
MINLQTRIINHINNHAWTPLCNGMHMPTLNKSNQESLSQRTSVIYNSPIPSRSVVPNFPSSSFIMTQPGSLSLQLGLFHLLLVLVVRLVDRYVSFLVSQLVAVLALGLLHIVRT